MNEIPYYMESSSIYDYDLVSKTSILSIAS